MSDLDALLWGMVGVLCLEGSALLRALEGRQKLPWRATDMWAYIAVVLIQLIIGGTTALAAAASNQVSSPIAALAIGAAVPTFLSQMARRVKPTQYGDYSEEEGVRRKELEAFLQEGERELKRITTLGEAGLNATSHD